MSKKYESKVTVVAACMINRLSPPPPVSNDNSRYNSF